MVPCPGGGDGAQFVALEGLARQLALDLAAAGELLQCRDDDRLRVDVEVPPCRAAGVGEPEPVRAERGVVARHPARDLVGHRPHPVRDRHDRAGRVGQRGRDERRRRLLVGFSSACCSHSIASRRSSFHDVTDHTSASTPHSSPSSRCASSAHGIATPEASSCARGRPVRGPEARASSGTCRAAFASTSRSAGSARLQERLVVDRQVVEDVVVADLVLSNVPTPYIRASPARTMCAIS